MELFEFIKILNRNKKSLLLSVLIFILVAAGLTFVQPLQYSARSRLLIVQDNGSLLDPYSASKANEYLSNVLTNVVVSTSFYEDVTNAGFDIDTGYFTKSSGQLTQKWQKTVEAKSVGDLGLIEITVYHSDKYQLNQIAQAINYTLKTKNSQYHNAGDKVTIKVIDEPVLSSLPVRPNIILNFLLALFLGVVFGCLLVYLKTINKLSRLDEVQIADKPVDEPERTRVVESIIINELPKEVEVIQVIEPQPTPRQSIIKPTANPSSEVSPNFIVTPKDVETVQPPQANQPEISEPQANEEEIFDGDIKNIYGIF